MSEEVQVQILDEMAEAPHRVPLGPQLHHLGKAQVCAPQMDSLRSVERGVNTNNAWLVSPYYTINI